VVQEHGLDLAEVAPFLLLALDEFVFEGLDLGLHLVGLEHAGVVDAAFGVELAHLCVEELGVVLERELLLVGLQVRRRDRELLLDADYALVDAQVGNQLQVFV